MIGRRVFVAGSVAAAALPALAAKSSLPRPKIAAIRWPGPGYEMHGYMAVPAKAHGPQPAVLVIHDASGADRFALGVTDALAMAGFVTCLPRALASLDEGTATAHWLAANPYATGKVGAVGIGWGADMVARIAAAPDSPLACGVAFGGEHRAEDGTIPLLSLPALTASTDPPAYAAAWQRATTFLAEHLGLPGKRPPS